MGPSQCRILPFIHSLSGRDTTSFSFVIGKKTWMFFSKTIEIDALEDFAESKDCFLLTEAAKKIVHCCIHKTCGHFGNNLAEIRSNKFLNNKSTLLKLLPQTEETFIQHLTRAMLATIIDKTAHIPKPIIPLLDYYG